MIPPKWPATLKVLPRRNPVERYRSRRKRSVRIEDIEAFHFLTLIGFFFCEVRVGAKRITKMSSTSRSLSNDTFPDPMRPLAPEEIEAQGRADKQAFTGFNKMDNVVSLINSETLGKMSSSSFFPYFRSSFCPGLTV
ncbi:hypothetical protein TNCV_4143251 [Trichonephila clavipes]|nr:hypothetical protein TNCV_4143251 [Trichonephila clavipes]